MFGTYFIFSREVRSPRRSRPPLWKNPDSAHRQAPVGSSLRAQRSGVRTETPVVQTSSALFPFAFGWSYFEQTRARGQHNDWQPKTSFPRRLLGRHRGFTKELVPCVPSNQCGTGKSCYISDVAAPTWINSVPEVHKKRRQTKLPNVPLLTSTLNKISI